jgi:hypothetical protein
VATDSYWSCGRGARRHPVRGRPDRPLGRGPKSALCQSGIGQIGQAIDTTVAHDCGLVNGLEAAVGWLLVLGVLAVAFGGYVIYNSRATAQPVPAGPWSGPPSP